MYPVEPSSRAAVLVGAVADGPVWPKVTDPLTAPTFPFPDESAAVVEPAGSFNFHQPTGDRLRTRAS